MVFRARSSGFPQMHANKEIPIKTSSLFNGIMCNSHSVVLKLYYSAFLLHYSLRCYAAKKSACLITLHFMQQYSPLNCIYLSHIELMVSSVRICFYITACSAAEAESHGLDRLLARRAVAPAPRQQ